jgi:hypothetical protein
LRYDEQGLLARYVVRLLLVPVALDLETQRIAVIVQAPGLSSSLAEVPMLAVA